MYHLLVKYRSKQLENFNMDDEDEEHRSALMCPDKLMAQPPSKPISTSHSSGTDAASEDSQGPRPSRPDAPTPRRAMQNDLESPIASIPTYTTVEVVHPTRSNTTSISRPSENRPAVARIPKINLQHPTPARALPAPPMQSSIEAKPTQGSAVSPILQNPVSLADSEAMQILFRTIADRLASIQARQSTSTDGINGIDSPDLQALAIAALSLAGNRESFRPTSSAAPPPPTPATGVFPFVEGDSRFEDAYEPQPNAGSTAPLLNPRSGETYGGYGLGILDQPNEPQMRPPPRPPLRHGHGRSDIANGASRRVSPMAPPPGTIPVKNKKVPPPLKLSNKENGLPTPIDHDEGRGRPRTHSYQHTRGTNYPQVETNILKPRPSIRSEGAAPRRVGLGNKHVQIVDPHDDVEWADTKHMKGNRNCESIIHHLLSIYNLTRR